MAMLERLLKALHACSVCVCVCVCVFTALFLAVLCASIVKLGDRLFY